MLKPVEGAPLLLAAVAVHEAAHVVLCHYFGYRVESVYAFTDGGINGERGRFEFNDGPRTNGDAWMLEYPEAVSCIYAAGCIAQTRVLDGPFPWDNGEPDRAAAARVIASERQRQTVQWRTRRLVDRLWPWVESLAEQLLRRQHLDGRQVRGVLAGCPVEPRARGPRGVVS